MTRGHYFRSLQCRPRPFWGPVATNAESRAWRLLWTVQSHSCLCWPLMRKSRSHFSYLGSSVGIDSIASPVICQWRLCWVESVFLHYSWSLFLGLSHTELRGYLTEETFMRCSANPSCDMKFCHEGLLYKSYWKCPTHSLTLHLLLGHTAW